MLKSFQDACHCLIICGIAGVEYNDFGFLKETLEDNCSRYNHYRFLNEMLT